MLTITQYAFEKWRDGKSLHSRHCYVRILNIHIPRDSDTNAHASYTEATGISPNQWECCCCSLRIFVINNTRAVCSTKEYTVSANKAQRDVIKPNWYSRENVVEGKDNYCQRNSLLLSSYRNLASTHLLKRLPQDAGMWLYLHNFIIYFTGYHWQLY